eukprot:m.187449 g.187449  ORF g.187449 m.187449 type:complete len:58 (-) comp13625_c0_seq21:1070-1243(-)
MSAEMTKDLGTARTKESSSTNNNNINNQKCNQYKINDNEKACNKNKVKRPPARRRRK